MEIAVISDIHGNSFALREVLKDIQNRGIEHIINLGDSLYGPLDPRGTFELMQRNNVISICGNQDRIIIENLAHKSKLETLEYVKSQIHGDMVEWLKSLPFDRIFGDEIFCCHASPQSDTMYLLEKLKNDSVAVKDRQEIDRVLTDVKQRFVFCGHSHISRIVETEHHWVINPGSVGLPAYDDDLPIYHKMESHNASSSYVAFSLSDGSYKANRISIQYDSESAAKLAEKNNRNDWAQWIRTGVV